jgi:L-asparaginase II
MDLSVKTRVQDNAFANPFMGDVPLVAVERGGFVGNLHRGIITVSDSSGKTLLSIGDSTAPVFLRSAAKPFQAMPAVLSGAIDRFSITQQELAVLCASHSGEQRHLDAVLSVLEKIGVGESALKCGAHPPLDEENAMRRARAGVQPSPVCNNCSGAHVGLLAACKANGWPLETYTDSNHPIQQQIREILGTFAGLQSNAVEYAIDNCAIPTWRLPIANAAQAFARLASGEQLESDLQTTALLIVQAMTAYPEMVGGDKRFDTDLMRAGRGAIVAKGGAEGFQGIGLIGQQRGIAIKITDGNARAIPPSALRVLDHLYAFDRQQAHELDGYREPTLRNLQEEFVGAVRPIFSIGAVE